jgi:hypothetical protein
MSKTAEVQHQDWLHGLYEISKAINATLDLDRVLAVIARETQRVVASDCQIVGLLVDEGAHIETHTFRATGDSDLRPEKATVATDGHPFGHVVETREPLFIDHLGSEDRFPAARSLAERGLVSCILLPLCSGDRVLGVLGLFRTENEPFARECLGLLREVAEQTAIGVEHAHLYAAEKKRAHQLAIINEVARHALGTFDLDVLLDQTASLIQEHFAFYDVSIFTVDEAAGEVVLRAQSGSYEAESAIGYRQGLDVGMVGWAARTGETRVASDVATDSQYVVAFEGERASRSELCVPIRIGGRTVGVINVECTEVGAFDSTDVAAMQTLADQIAQAIESARIYDEMLYLKELDESILASIPSALLVLDRELEVLAVNDACCRTLDRTEDQVVGASFEEMFRFELLDSALIRRTIARVVDHDDVAVFPAVQVALPNGRERIVDLHFRAIARQDERRALAFLNDITERRQAEEEVIRERQKLNDVVSAMGAGLALIDPDGTVSWSNRTLEQWFNNGESLVGHDCHTLCQACPEGERPGSNCPIFTAFENAEITRSTQTLHADHRTRHYENVFAPIRSEQGHVVQVIRLTFDVTEHLQKLEQLSLLQKLSQTMEGALNLDRLLRLVLTCVTAGPGLGFNRAVLLLEDDEHEHIEGRLGVGPASGEEASRIWRELASQPLTLADHILRLFEQESERTEGPMQYVAQQIRVPLTKEDHVLVRTFNEKQPHVVRDAQADESVPEKLPALLSANEFVCVPLVAHGTALGAIIADKVFTGEPITEDEVEMLKTFASHAGAAIQAAASYRRLEEQLHEIQETQERMVRAERLATVGRLAAHVAHEIRNPLVTIGGFARSILRKPKQLHRVERNAQIILDEVERLEQILANVMNFTKPGNPVLQDRNVNEVAEAVCAFHENVFAERDITLHKNLDPNCPPLRIDPGQIRQVLINIVQNAVDSMPDGGDLTLATQARKNDVLISVTDTGEGMSQEVLDNLFQPFYTTKVGGTGLGLPASQKIVQEHGGEITVDSQPGKGSTFTISLPIPETSDDDRNGGTTQ